MATQHLIAQLGDQTAVFVPKSTPKLKMAEQCVSVTTTTPALTLNHANLLTSASSAKARTHPAGASRPLDDHQPYTPIDLVQLELELKHHPDKVWTSHLIQRLTNGTEIGYLGPRATRSTHNLTSSRLHPNIIDQHLQRECDLGHMAGPYTLPPCPRLQCSGVGLVPKKSGSWRMIMHLSAPPGKSINDGIPKDLFSLRYSTIDDACKLIAAAGHGAFLAKIDLKTAFRLIPVAKKDWELLGIHWRDAFYVDKQLPFGLRSAPFLFNELATAIHWVLEHNYQIPSLIHYLDDFLLVAQSETTASQNKATMLSLCSRLSIPLSWDKVEGPTTCLSFLGIEIDTVRWELRLPQEKLTELIHLLTTWSSTTKCTKRQLLSLIGKLNFATKVIPAGRIFLRRLINRSTAVDAMHHHLYLNAEARADIAWWLIFLPRWNGRAPILQPKWTLSSTLQLFTDASGSHGFGAYYQGAWFRGSWLPHQQLNPATGISIAWQELYAIVAAAAAWGKAWTGRRIMVHCDNQAVVDIWDHYTSKSPTIMCLVRTLHLIAATNNFHIRISHIQGVDNSIADALSRGRISTFRRLVPDADITMTKVPVITSLIPSLQTEYGLTAVLPGPHHVSTDLHSNDTGNSATAGASNHFQPHRTPSLPSPLTLPPPSHHLQSLPIYRPSSTTI